ncbi:MAG: MraY family glycosyltransferase [Burkholderiales bacterium]
MTGIIIASALAFLISTGLVWLMLRAPSAVLPLDRPNERSLHTAVTPRVGGIAIMVAVASVLTWLEWQSTVVLLAAGLSIVSLLDDHSGLPTLVRFGAHAMAAAIFVGCCAGELPAWLAIGMVVGTIWMTNLYNFMDGSDGLAGGMAAFGFGTYSVLAWQQGDPLLASASLAIAAAAIGFLVFNFHPAKVFMGDAGSIPLGFLAAAIGVLGWRESLWPPWVPIVAFGPFAIDASVTLFKRMARREKIWQAHRTHYYQRLVQCGWGHRRTALAEYGLMGLSGLAAIGGAHQSVTVQSTLLTVLASIYALIGVMVDRAWAKHQRAKDHDRG